MFFILVTCYMIIPVAYSRYLLHISITYYTNIHVIDSCSLHDTYPHTRTTIVYTTWRMFPVYLILALDIREVMGTHQTMSTYTPL